MIEMGQKGWNFSLLWLKWHCCVLNAFGLVYKAEMIILSTFCFCCTKSETLIWKRKKAIKIYHIYKFQQAVICGKAVFKEDLLHACIKFNWSSALLTLTPSFSMKCMKLFPFYGSWQPLNVEGYKKMPVSWPAPWYNNLFGRENYFCKWIILLRSKPL